VLTLNSGLCLIPCLRELGGRGDVWFAAIAWGCDGVGTKDILQLKGTGLWIAAGERLPLSTTGAVELQRSSAARQASRPREREVVWALERDGPRHWRVTKCVR
jgi:hypothetical protein